MILINKAKIHSTFIITFLFSLIVLTILLLNLPRGFMLGGDWTFPFSDESYEVWKTFTAWNSKQNFGDSSVLSINGLYYKLLVNLIYNVGVPLKYIQLTIIIAFFIIGQIGFVIFFKYYFQSEKIIHILTLNIFSLFFIFSPPSFNFLVMGWILASISYLLYPFFLYFLFKATNKDSDFINCLIASLLFSFAIMQIHTVAWYLLMSLIFLFRPGANAKKFFINYSKIFLLTIFFNIHWIFPLLMDFNIASQIAPEFLYKTSATKGMDLFLNFFNIFKFHGSLFNEHYEIWFKNLFPLYSNIFSLAPFLLLLLLLIYNRDNYLNLVFSYIVVIIVSLIIININKEDFFYAYPILIPFRHLSRMIIVLPFLFYYLILSMLFNQFEKSKFVKRTIILSLILINCINIYPWTTHLSYNKKNLQFSWEKQFKLREYNPPKDYIAFYDKIDQDKDKFQRSLYFPYGALIYFNDDVYFSAGFLSIVDIFSTTSPVPGAITLGAGRFSNSQFFIEQNFVKQAHKKFSKSLLNNLHSVDLFIYRKNVSSNVKLSIDEFHKLFQDKNSFTKYFESENIVAYERINNKNSLVESLNLDSLEAEDLQGFNILLHKKSDYKKYFNNKLKVDYERSNDSIIYIKNYNNPHKHLVFHESFSENWCMFNSKKINNLLLNNLLIIKNYFSQGCSNKHYPIFNHSNAWEIKKTDNIILIFKPQIGFIISIFIYIIFLIGLILVFLKNIKIKKI
jgi:hypothetical protein